MPSHAEGKYDISIGLQHYADCGTWVWTHDEVNNVISKFARYCRRHNCDNVSCQRARVAELLRRIETFDYDESKQKFLVTLTIPNVRYDEMVSKEFWRVFGLNAMECLKSEFKQVILFPETTFNPKRRDFHCHFHAIVNKDVPVLGKATSDVVSSEFCKKLEMSLFISVCRVWVKKYPGINIWAQDVKIVTNNYVKSYLTKYVSSENKRNPKVHVMGLRYLRSNVSHKVKSTFEYKIVNVAMEKRDIPAVTLDSFSGPDLPVYTIKSVFKGWVYLNKTFRIVITYKYGKHRKMMIYNGSVLMNFSEEIPKRMKALEDVFVSEFNFVEMKLRIQKRKLK